MGSWMAIVVIAVFYVLAAPSSSSGKLPDGVAAVVRGFSGNVVRLPMEELQKRRIQVEAERRVIGAHYVVSIASESLRQLLEEVDVEFEGSRRGLGVSQKQIATVFRQIKRRDFSSLGEFHRYLRRIRMSEDEARHRVKIQMLAKAIEEQVAEGTSVFRRAEVLGRFAKRYVLRWRNRTICRVSLATERCVNGPPPSDEGETGFAFGPSPRDGEDASK